jgi:subtilisin family serine protease
MKAIILVLFTLTVLSFAINPTTILAPVLNLSNAKIIEGEYIVVFKPNVTEDVLQAHIQANVPAEDLLFTYTAALTGFAAKLDQSQLLVHRSSPYVDYIEPNQVMTAYACTTQSRATWGLGRVSESGSPKGTDTFRYDTTAGSGVRAYIIDTGIRITHTDFGGRALWGYNAVSGSTNTDLNGHGTHVASTTGGTTYGVAKRATLVAIKVLGDNGSGSNAGVIAGVEWAYKDANGRRSVANMSLGGGATTALDTAVNNGVAAGTTYVVAAGNDNANACNYSPARATGAITVGATSNGAGVNGNDIRASFSNYGTCVDIFGPGQDITAAWITNDSATRTISGTSMASPHVAGVVALQLSVTNRTPSAMKSYLNDQSNKNTISNPGTGSPNRMVYSPCS